MNTKTKRAIRDACYSVGLVAIMLVSIVAVAQTIALKTIPASEVFARAPAAATSLEAEAAAEAANSPYARGYGRDDYMASPRTSAQEEVMWFFGEGEAAPADLLP